jgi:hypothetical protein
MRSKKFLADAADSFVYFFGELQRVWFGSCSGEAVFFNVVAFLFFFAEEFRFFNAEDPHCTMTPSTSMLSRSSPPCGRLRLLLWGASERRVRQLLSRVFFRGPFTDDDAQVDRFDFSNVTLFLPE